MYGFCGFSLRQTAAVAAANGLADVSDVALLKRFRKCGPWLGELLGRVLQRHAVAALPEREYRLRLIDATTVNAPGSKTTGWRVHLVFDLRRKCIEDIDITDGSGGETLRRFQYQTNDIVIADRGYAHRSGFDLIEQSGAFFLVRINWSNTPLEDPSGKAVDILELLRSIPEAAAAEFDLRYKVGNRITPVRLVAVRKTEAAAQRARQKALTERRKKGAIDPRTLEATGYTFVLTNLPQDLISADQLMELYRFRWQIELAFKRLKSVIQLDVLPAKDPALARMYLYARLLGAVVIDDLTARYLSFSPWGYAIGGPSFVMACSEDPS
jgi:IS4 transposase